MAYCRPAETKTGAKEAKQHPKQASRQPGKAESELACFALDIAQEKALPLPKEQNWDGVG